jgi:hypothetical protein
LALALAFGAFVCLNNPSLLGGRVTGKPLLLAHRGLHQTYHTEGLTAETCTAARIHPPWNDLAERTWRLEDLMSNRVFVRDGTEIATDGLYVQLAPWEFHVFAWNDAPDVNA